MESDRYMSCLYQVEILVYQHLELRKRDRQKKKMFQCVVIASVVLENILMLWGRHLAPFGVGVGSESKGRSQEICHM